MIFEIILINEFPDFEPDASVGKKTIVVRFGVKAGTAVYGAALVVTYLVAAGSLFFDKVLFYPAIAYLLTLPLGIKILRLINNNPLTDPKDVRANAMTVQIHILGSLAITAGFLIYGFRGGHL